MATAKPKTKRMMFGGMASGVSSRAIGAAKNAAAAKAAPMKTQSSTQSALKSVPAYAQPYVNKMQSRGALGGNRPPAGSNLMQAYNAQKSGATGTGPQRAMKKGGAVKKATKK